MSRKEKIVGKSTERKRLLCGVLAVTTAVALNNTYGEDVPSLKPIKKSTVIKNKDFLIMRYSTLPSSATLNAWTDESYLENLLNNPNSILNEFFGRNIKLNFIGCCLAIMFKF